ncbi:MAG: hypothetical protein U0X93_07895 [Anaerolineales bacterium]
MSALLLTRIVEMEISYRLLTLLSAMQASVPMMSLMLDTVRSSL